MEFIKTLMETSHPGLMDLTLGEIIKDGKVTNFGQTFTLAKAISYVMDPAFCNRHSDNDFELPFSVTGIPATSSDLIDSLTKMTDEQAVELAAYLLPFVSGQTKCVTPDTSVEYIKKVLQAQPR